MKVLLISPNRERLPSPVFPLGLAYLSSALKKRGHEVRGLDLCFSADVPRDIARAVRSFRPGILGLSLRNIDALSMPGRSYLPGYRAVARALRRCSSAPLVLGGSGFTIMPAAFMKALGADYGVAGEGETAFPDLLREIRLGRAEKGGIYAAGRRLGRLDAVTPDRAPFLGPAHPGADRAYNIQTKRGCPFNCVYCTYPLIEGRAVRLRSPLSVARELERAAGETGARRFFITDGVFNYPEAHALEVCREISKRNLGITWSCYANPAYMTGRLAEAMARAGCGSVEFGIDSLSDDLLSRLGKNFSVAQVARAGALCAREGLPFTHFLFVGAPGDTDRRALRHLQLLEELAPASAVIVPGIRIFPGTRLAGLAARELGIKTAGLKPVFYFSRGVRDLAGIAAAVAARKNWALHGFQREHPARVPRRA